MQTLNPTLGEGNGDHHRAAVQQHHLLAQQQRLRHAGGSNTLVNKAFQDVGAVGLEGADSAVDKNPDVIPLFNSGEKKKENTRP